MILLEELSVLDLAAAPEFNLLMKAGPVLKWSDAGFWNKLRFYLPDASSRHKIYKRNLNQTTNLGLTRSTNSSSGSASPKATALEAPTSGGWQYDGLLRDR